MFQCCVEFVYHLELIVGLALGTLWMTRDSDEGFVDSKGVQAGDMYVLRKDNLMIINNYYRFQCFTFCLDMTSSFRPCW